MTLPAAVFFPGALSPGAPDITDKRLLVVPEVSGATEVVVMAGGVKPLSDDVTNEVGWFLTPSFSVCPGAADWSGAVSLTLALLLWPEIRQWVLLYVLEKQNTSLYSNCYTAAAVHFLLFQCTLIALFSHSFASFTDSRRSTVCFVKRSPKTNLMQICFRYIFIICWACFHPEQTLVSK